MSKDMGAYIAQINSMQMAQDSGPNNSMGATGESIIPMDGKLMSGLGEHEGINLGIGGDQLEVLKTMSGALEQSTTDILGNQEPFGIQGQGFLKSYNGVGDTSLVGTTPGRTYNAPQGFGAPIPQSQQGQGG